MKKLLFLLVLTISIGCEFKAETRISQSSTVPEVSRDSIEKALENWHAAAAEANFDDYFNLMAGDGIFIGTDATENWQNNEFRQFAKPYFEKGKAWSFSTLERNIYSSEDGKIAWFDELLDTQMGICRGSGVVEKTAAGWKIKHYVLSITVPNENVEEVTALKKDFDTQHIARLKEAR